LSSMSSSTRGWALEAGRCIPYTTSKRDLSSVSIRFVLRPNHPEGRTASTFEQAPKPGKSPLEPDPMCKSAPSKCSRCLLVMVAHGNLQATSLQGGSRAPVDQGVLSSLSRFSVQVGSLASATARQSTMVLTVISLRSIGARGEEQE